MNTAVLRGREHTILGGIAAIAEGPAAIALSRGGARKLYSHVDPNEDAAAFAEGEAGVLLAVADGHGGHEASEIAVAGLVEGRATDWTAATAAGLRERWSEESRAALFDACAAIREHFASAGLDTSRTTLAFALIRPGEDLLAWASIGDSHVFVIEAGEARDLAVHRRSQTWFLGHPTETPQSIEEKCLVGARDLAPARAVALVTDGLSERGIGVDAPPVAVAQAVQNAQRDGPAPDRLPLETARGIVETALAAHRRQRSGDNVAAAVAWLALEAEG